MVASTLPIVRQIGDEDIVAGRGPGQQAWYKFAQQFVQGKTVLDVGCGLGYGLEILGQSAKQVHGQDLYEQLQNTPNVVIGELAQFSDKSFDIVTSVEVIEHVEDDEFFVRELARIAREAFFVTTPNWTISRCTRPYHIREYTPMELYKLLRRFGQVQLYKGNSIGTKVYPVNHVVGYFFFNRLRIYPTTALGARVASRLLPGSMRLQGHNAALVTQLR